jgi:hypothetical protein
MTAYVVYVRDRIIDPEEFKKYEDSSVSNASRRQGSLRQPALPRGPEAPIERG